MTEVRLPASVKATLVEDIDRESCPGAIQVEGSGLWYECPCGCKSQAYLNFRPSPAPSWDYDHASVTLSPSVHHVGHWHGHLKAGYWVQA